MSKTLYSFFVPLVIVLVSGAGLFSLVPERERSAAAPDRTVYLEAENGEFRRGDKSNPSIRVRTGEVLRIVFRNTDHGVRHAITVPSKLDRVYRVDGGERASFTVTFGKPGTHHYTCPHHLPVMKGSIHVSSPNP